MNIPQKQSHKNNTTAYYGIDGPIGPTGPQGNAGADSSLTRTTGNITNSITLDKASNVSLLLWTLPINPAEGKKFAKILTSIKWNTGAVYQTAGFGVYYAQLELWDSLGNLRNASKVVDLASINAYQSTNPQASTNPVVSTFQIEDMTNNLNIGFTYQLFLRIYTTYHE